MNTERAWQTALSQLHDAQVSVYPALVGATVSLNGDSVLRVTLAGAAFLEQVEAYGVEKLSGYLSREIGGIERVEFRAAPAEETEGGVLKKHTPTPQSAEKAQGDVLKKHTPAPQTGAETRKEKPKPSNIGHFQARADVQREIFSRISHLKGPGSKIAAVVFGWLQGQVSDGDGWTRAVSYSDMENELAPNRQRIAEAIECLHRGGLILATGTPDEYDRRAYRLYGCEYVPLRAFSAQGMCFSSTLAGDPRAFSAHYLGVSVDVVDALRVLVGFLHQQQPPESESVLFQHTPTPQSAEKAQGDVLKKHAPTPQSAEKAQGDVPEKHTHPEADHRRKLLKAFGVTSPKALDDIAAATGEHGLDWLVGWMTEYQHRWVSNTEDGKKRWTKDQIVGQFVVQVRDHGDDPPEGPLKMARSRLGDVEESGGFTADVLREMLDGISHLTFSEWW